jgi:PAS domain S-box-containing protein
MNDSKKTKEQLIRELQTLRQRISQLEEKNGTNNQIEQELLVKDNAIASSINAIAIADMDTSLTYVNNSFLKLWGYDNAGEVLGKPAVSFWKTKDETQAVVRTLHDTGEWIGELIATKKDGSFFDVELITSMVKDKTGKPICIVASFVNIMERKQMQDALRESETRFQSIFENLVIGFYRTTPDGHILMANPALVRILGFSSPEELAQRNLEENGYEPEYPRSDFKRRIEKEGQVKGLDSAWKKDDGTMIFVRENARVVRDKAGKILYYEGTVEDFTERKRAEEALQKARDELELRVDQRTAELSSTNIKLEKEIAERWQAEQKLLDYQQKLRSLASQLSLAEQREHRRIAMELHDQVAQTLSFSTIKLGYLQNSAAGTEMAGAIDEVRKLINEAIQEIRMLIFDFGNPILYRKGLEEAVKEWLFERVGKLNRVVCEFHDDGQPKPLDEDIRVLLFQSVRELLANVVKHAQAAKIWVTTRRTDGNIEISVRDNGIGCNIAETGFAPGLAGGFGLFSIHERLGHLGGRFDFQSRPGHGTSVTLVAPLKQESTSKNGDPI